MPNYTGGRWSTTGPITTITWSFANSNFSGLQLLYSGYQNFDSQISASYYSIVRAAFAAWESVAYVDFVEVQDSTAANIRLGNATVDGPNGSILANTYYWLSGTQYKATEILLDVDAYNFNAKYLYSILVHEIGHAIGLDHSSSPDAIMYYQVGPRNGDGVLTADDLKGIAALYGGKVVIQPPTTPTTPLPTTDDYAASSATTGVVKVGGSVSGYIETIGDSDWFAVTLKAGSVYRLALEGSQTYQGTLPDPMLEVRSADGIILKTFDNSLLSANASGVFMAAIDGLYYLTAAASPAYSRTGSYHLSVVDITPVTTPVTTAASNILRNSNANIQNLVDLYKVGDLSSASVVDALVKMADATTSVATMNYQFFTGKAPSMGGIDYLVSPTGPNPNNLNSAYYQSFSLENRYINFAVNLGKVGEGHDAFAARYGDRDLVSTMRLAYSIIFGNAPTDDKIHVLLDTVIPLNGQSITRAEYFAIYGGDGPTGLGTKAAMVGWLLAEAEKADVGMYARSNSAFLHDLADGATFGVDLVGVYGKTEYAFS